MTRTRAALLIFLSKTFSLGLSLVAVRYYLEWLGKDSYGLFTYGGILATYLIFVDISVPSAAIQYVTNAHARGKDRLALFYHRTQLALQILMVSAIALLALAMQALPASWLGLNVPFGKEMFAVMSLSTILVSLNGAFTGLFVSKDLFQIIALRESVITAISAGAGIWAVWQYRTPMALAWVTASASLLTLVINGLLTAKMFSWKALIPVRSKPLERKLLSYTLRGYAQRVSIQVFRTVDRLLLPRAINFSALTDYNNGYRIPDTIHVVHVAALQPVQPHLTREAAKGPEAFGKAIDRMSRMMALIGVCTLLVPAGFGYSLLKLWLGPHSPVGGEWVVLLVGLSMAMQTYYMGLAFAAYAQGKPEKLVIPTVAKCVAMIVLTIPFARQWGIIGVAALNAGFDVLQFVPYSLFLHKTCKLPFDIAPHMAKTALCFAIGLAITLGGFALTQAGPFLENPILGLALLPVLAVISGIVLTSLRLSDLPDGVARRLAAWKGRSAKA